MIDETYRARWASRLAFLACAGALAFACGNDSPPDDGDGDGGSSQGGSSGSATGGAGPTGGSSPTGGIGGSVTGGTGSGGVAPTGGVGPTGGSAGAPTGGTAGAGAPTGGVGPGGTGGSGGSGSMLLGPIQRGQNYVLEFGDVYFEVSPAGARVIDVHLAGGMNLLTAQSVDPNGINYGSTFWPSPQTWAWPPTTSIPQINDGPYTATVEAASVLLVGQNAATVGASVMKRFTADLASGNVVADYALVATAAGKMFAPWEITRVFKRGITFWPTGSAPRAGGSFALPPTMDAAGCTWHQAPTANGADQKLLANGTGGWLAHVDGDVVIVKKFPDIMAAQAAPNEDEIELFVNGTSNYIEVEQQGAYGAVAMGSMLTWQVTWIVKRLPTGLMPTVGNPDLVTFVQSLVQ
jgi:hypothetical protein